MPVKEACDSGDPKRGTLYVRQTSHLCHMLEFCLGATAGFFQDRFTIVAGTSHIIAIRIDYDFACCVGVVSPAWVDFGCPSFAPCWNSAWVQPPASFRTDLQL